MKSLRYLLAMAAMSLFTVACVEEEPVPYEPGQPDVEGCYGVYFPVQEATGAHTYDPTQTPEIVFTVARTNSNQAITVPVDVKASHEGIFEVGELKFEDGQSETTLTVTFPNSETGVNYSLSLGITDPLYASVYNDGDVNIDFSVLRVEWKDFLNPVTNEPAVFTFEQGWWGETHTATIKYYEVDGLRTCVATCIEVDADGNPLGIWGDTQNIQFNFTWNTKLFNPSGYQVVDVPKQYFGFDYADWESKPESEAVNPVYFYDWFHYLTTDGGYAGAWADWAGFLSKNPGAYDQSYYDGNGGFYFNLKYHVPPLGGFTPDVFDVVALADGFVRVDYSLSAATDYTVDGVVPVQIKAGADIATINYVAVAGKVNSVEMEELLPTVVDGTAENLVTIEESDMTATETGKAVVFGLTFPATGEYTVVAVGFDAEGNAKASTSIVLDYVAADDATYDVEFEVIAEKTPARYEAEKLTQYNSFAYTIYGGNDLTAAHVGIFETASVKAAGESVVVSTVRGSKYALSEEALAAVNTVAGYSNIQSGLKDGVSYTVVVWATNGKQTKASFTEFTTVKSPEKFKSLGMGLYTEDFLAGLFQGMECLTYEVEIEESLDNPGKYRLVNPYGAAFPYNEPGDYDDSQDYYLVINAQDPNGVYVPESAVGCDWGYGEWVLYSYAAYYMDNMGATLTDVKAAGMCGTLVDGVITFPKDALLLTASGLGGQYYNGNSNGAFKVVLPSARGAEGDAEGTETASVKPSSISANPVLENPMTVGHSTGIDYSENVKTVACEVVSSVKMEKSSRNSEIKVFSGSLN